MRVLCQPLLLPDLEWRERAAEIARQRKARTLLPLDVFLALAGFLSEPGRRRGKVHRLTLNKARIEPLRCFNDGLRRQTLNSQFEGADRQVWIPCRHWETLQHSRQF